MRCKTARGIPWHPVLPHTTREQILTVRAFRSWSGVVAAHQIGAEEALDCQIVAGGHQIAVEGGHQIVAEGGHLIGTGCQIEVGGALDCQIATGWELERKAQCPEAREAVAALGGQY